MSRMNELSRTIEELIACGQALINTASALKACFSSEPEAPAAEVPAAEPAAPVEPVAPAKVYSFIDVRKAAAGKSHAGHTDAVRALIAKYGADRLSGLREGDYGAFMADLEGLA